MPTLLEWNGVDLGCVDVFIPTLRGRGARAARSQERGPTTGTSSTEVDTVRKERERRDEEDKHEDDTGKSVAG